MSSSRQISGSDAWIAYYHTRDVFFGASILFGSILCIWRQNRPPLSNRNVFLLVMSTTGLVCDIILAETPLPCWLSDLLNWISPHLFGGCGFLMAVRLHFRDRFERRKAVWVKKRITPEMLVEIQRERNRFSTLYLFGYWVGLLLFSAVIAIPAMVFAECNPGSAWFSFQIIFIGLEYVVLVFWAVRKIWGIREAFGVKNELRAALVYAGGAAVVMEILSFALPSVAADPTSGGNPFIQLYIWAQIVWVYHAVIRLPLLTFPCTRRCYKSCTKKRLTPEGGDPSLEDILSTELGFAYLYVQLRREYSEENLMCIQSMDKFSRRPSYKRMRDIVDRYLAPGAPLEVNIDYVTRSKVVRESNKWQQNHDPQQYRDIFRAVRAQLAALIEGNSLHRFRNSDLYDRFLQKEPLPLEAMLHDAGAEDTELTHTIGSAVMVSDFPDHQEARESVVHSQQPRPPTVQTRLSQQATNPTAGLTIGQHARQPSLSQGSAGTKNRRASVSARTPVSALAAATQSAGVTQMSPTLSTPSEQQPQPLPQSGETKPMPITLILGKHQSGPLLLPGSAEQRSPVTPKRLLVFQQQPPHDQAQQSDVVFHAQQRASVSSPIIASTSPSLDAHASSTTPFSGPTGKLGTFAIAHGAPTPSTFDTTQSHSDGDASSAHSATIRLLPPRKASVDQDW